jgi:phage gp46-like protein
MQEQYIHIDEYGSKIVYKDREMKIYHRLDGPAIECADGDRAWWLDDKLHRLDGPAFEYADGSKAWFVDGKRHRLDGPAIEYADGSKLWYVDGKLHRLDGPAVEYADEDKAWYVNGKRLTEEQFNALTAPTLELTLEDIAAKFGVDVGKIKIVK